MNVLSSDGEPLFDLSDAEMVPAISKMHVLAFEDNDAFVRFVCCFDFIIF